MMKGVRDAKHLGLNYKNTPQLRRCEEKMLERGLRTSAQRFLAVLPSVAVDVAEKFLLLNSRRSFGAEETEAVERKLAEMKRAQEAAAANLASAIRLRNVAYLKETIAACRKLGYAGSDLIRAEKVRHFILTF